MTRHAHKLLDEIEHLCARLRAELRASDNTEPHWLAKARGELGISEPRDGNRIRDYQAATRLDEEALSDEPWTVPWCAAFVSWALGGGTHSAAARSYLRYGEPVPLHDLRVGTILVFWRGSRDDGRTGHVGFYTGPDPLDSGNVLCLSGNQSSPAFPAGSVNIKPYPSSRLIGARWPQTQ